MKKAKMVSVLAVSVALILVSVGQAAPTTYMDASLHNGALTAASVGYWSDVNAKPAGWDEAVPTAYTAGGGTVKWTMITGNGTVVNNTGESFLPNQQYTIQADLGGFDGYPATVKVYATQYADGTGNKALLASLSRMGHNSVDGYNLFTVSNTGSGVGSAYAGYYIQVALEGSGYYDNIVVTSDVATSMTYMNETLHNGSLTAVGAGNWADGYAPAGWAETLSYSCYQAGNGTWTIIASSYAGAVNNTGELVQASHAFTVSASLGCSAADKTATVEVWATQNIDGTGAKALLATVSRYEATGIPTYTLYPVVGTPGSPTRPSLAGYYVQVKLVGGYSYFDNIVVTSEEAPILSMTYMDAALHNGSLTADAAGNWADGHTPAGWAESMVGGVYQTAYQWTMISSPLVTAYNNTGELVQAGHVFTVSASLGGTQGSTASVQVYATQNIDGTGAKVLLAEVSRLEETGVPTYTLYPVVGTPGSTSAPNLAGYYVQVVLLGGGAYYDTVVVTSELSDEPPTITYMDAILRNGAMTATYYGFWNDPDSKPLGGWESTDDPNIYTAGEIFTLFGADETGDREVFNNTGELVPVNHQFTIQADLGGKTGATATVRVYATENADGTGDKVLLTQVNRPGNDADGYGRFTVSGIGLVTASPVEGYYVQIVLKPIGTGNCYFDNIVVTSTEAVPVTSKTYMDGTLNNGALTATSSGGLWTSPDYVPSDGWFADDPNYVYTTSSMFTASQSPAGEVVNNTQEFVPGAHQFAVQADLGGVTGATAEVFVYATENWDGTGNKVLLVQASRAGNNADGFTLFTVSNTGSLTLPSLNGYYVQVVLKTTGNVDLNGYYDNIIVTSSEPPACGDVEHPYPDGDLTRDCYVDGQDLEMLAGQWLASGCVEPEWCSGADLTQESNVDLEDFAVLAANWLDCTDPMLPCSYNP